MRSLVKGKVAKCSSGFGEAFVSASKGSSSLFLFTETGKLLFRSDQHGMSFSQVPKKSQKKHQIN
jgi:hypothetical protein